MFLVIEIVMILKQGFNLKTSNMQFAYKSGHSTTIATAVLKDVINQFMSKGSDVYCCFIDASKAFDRLQHDILFKLLLERNVHPLTIRILVDSYERQTLQTNWQGATSKKFSCTNGVRQGGILSPIFYSIYNDVLLKRLYENGNGCWIGHHFFGAISYADDLCIISPSITGLQNMLNVCTEYGHEYDVLFNPQKTKCVKFSKQRNGNPVDIDVKLCNQKLSWTSEIKYLGNWLKSDLSEDLEINKKTGYFHSNVNICNLLLRT